MQVQVLSNSAQLKERRLSTHRRFGRFSMMRSKSLKNDAMTKDAMSDKDNTIKNTVPTCPAKAGATKESKPNARSKSLNRTRSFSNRLQRSQSARLLINENMDAIDILSLGDHDGGKRAESQLEAERKGDTKAVKQAEWREKAKESSQCKHHQPSQDKEVSECDEMPFQDAFGDDVFNIDPSCDHGSFFNRAWDNDDNNDNANCEKRDKPIVKRRQSKSEAPGTPRRRSFTTRRRGSSRKRSKSKSRKRSKSRTRTPQVLKSPEQERSTRLQHMRNSASRRSITKKNSSVDDNDRKKGLTRSLSRSREGLTKSPRRSVVGGDGELVRRRSLRRVVSTR